MENTERSKQGWMRIEGAEEREDYRTHIRLRASSGCPLLLCFFSIW